MSKTYISYDQTAIDGGFKVVITHKFSDSEHQNMLDRGGPVEVNLGGNFTETVPVFGSTTLNLPDNYRDFPDNFPQSFTIRYTDVGDDFDIAQAQVIAWRMHAITEITSALQTRWTAIGELSTFVTEVEEEIVST